mmetsp:Transcript_4710/g.11678  ORF Transcript_4710/g.11678 Transcript_4710/m.11678 type:complete len:273 (-) Transcript_4710:354-1172(-)|eukprot:CAMPEP_0185187902 /NCGR_PEP_ID=MMETSP1140-20130426/5058_1 /TAXON_ID=298111 /ORGANISM="Pavlova sp., Strain CCMP459" /LENGTH=272 /DNA_ID=CAMNT_0027754357 /DNA_START=46 /DNA_END=864 /DNA_ORIENTATION=-
MKVACLLAIASGAAAAHAGPHHPSRVLAPFAEGRALKVISGLMNFDKASVAKVCSAAEKGGASLVDIACDPELVKVARSKTQVPICVSAVEPERFVAAVDAGADMVEIGNYDSFYGEGRVFSAEDVMQMTRETRELLPNVPLSVTVPHTLPLDQQVQLAEALLAHNVDVIQTEGGTSSRPEGAGVLGMIEKASPSLAATYEISRCVGSRVHVMAASGITDVTAPLALAMGAAGVGVGSAVNKLEDEMDMTFAVRRIVDALAASQVKDSRIAH